VVTAVVEPSLAAAKPDQKLQFERQLLRGRPWEDLGRRLGVRSCLLPLTHRQGKRDLGSATCGLGSGLAFYL